MKSISERKDELGRALPSQLVQLMRQYADDPRSGVQKLLAKAQKDLDFINKKLNNPGFLNKAPEQVVEGERVKATKLNDQIAKLNESIAALN